MITPPKAETEAEAEDARADEGAPSRSAEEWSANRDGRPTATSPLADVKPAYFYPMPSTSQQPAREDDLPGVPVFEPTIEQFSDFYAFCQAIDTWGMQSGIVKIVPPQAWIDALPTLLPAAKHEGADLRAIRIKQAITQHFLSAGPGRWKQTNVTRSKPLDAKQWADICKDAQHRGPAMSRIQRQVATSRAAEQAHAHSRLYRTTKTEAPEVSTDTPRKLTRSGGQGLARPVSHPRKRRGPPVTKDEDWAQFDYRASWLDEALTDAEKAAGVPMSPAAWDTETCRAIEAEYWRTLNLGAPPMYGADQQGTLFDARTTQWNVGTLDSLLSRTFDCALPGVTTPYLYFGMWRASFAWHVEDMDLYSINYIHFGAPKQWYAIRQADRKRFESVMAASFPTDARKCSHFLRHKSFLVSPSFLQSQGITPLRLVQHANEFVITYPYGYHAGFNLGFNCAESVNFALPTWIDIGRQADYCRCSLAQESVHIDMEAWWPTQPTAQAPALPPRTSPTERKPPSIPPPSALYPCVFCPRTTSDALVPLPEAVGTQLAHAAASKKSLEASAQPWHAHQLCACFLPECWVEHAGTLSSMVQGAETIDRARWALKCQVCGPASKTARHGCKIQCTKGKCPRAVHVSCALDEESGWFIDLCATDVADRLEGVATASSTADERLVVLCRAHNPLRLEAEAAKREAAWAEKICALPCPGPIHIKTQGAVWTTTLRSIDTATKEVVIDAARSDYTTPPLRVPWSRVCMQDAAVRAIEHEYERTHQPITKKRRVHCAVDVPAAEPEQAAT